MELSHLRDEIFKIFNIASTNELSNTLLKVCLDHDINKFNSFVNLVEEDLSVDWLQKIYQYYEADRKEKKQDYTPKTLAKLVAALVKNDNEVIDLCAGSGALTIQAWSANPKTKFTLYELDEKVIPILLFNLAVRGINADVFQGDVLNNDFSAKYKVSKDYRSNFSRVQLL